MHSMKVKLHFCDGNEIRTRGSAGRIPGATSDPLRGSIGGDRRNERSKDASSGPRERDQRRRAKRAKESERGVGDRSVKKKSPNTARSRRLTQRPPLAKDLSASAAFSFSLSLVRFSFSFFLSLCPYVRLSFSSPVAGLKHSNMLLVSSSFYIGKRQ